MIPRILAIAGSDSGGGAGIQADIKTITMLGGHAMTAITAITAQNTLGVSRIELISPEMVVAQAEAVVSDIGVDAIKIGMIGSVATIHAVADFIEKRAVQVPFVFDPVMVATSGSPLADADTIAGFERLMRLAALVTPNLPELAALEPDGDGALLARRLQTAVLAKGGHGDGETLYDRLHLPSGEAREWRDRRIDSTHTHGTGCTLASAIATGLGMGLDLPDAIDRARRYVRDALHAAPGLGSGHGPVGVPFSKYPF